MKNATIFLSFLFFSMRLSAQNESVIPYFRASELAGKVFLEWEVKQGNTCNGIDILRSTDSTNFEKVGDIEGICGSTQASIRYTFTDATPVLNTVNYYRLSLGGVGFSWVIEVNVRFFGKGNYALYPNPIVSKAELRFDNDQGKSVVLTVLDLSGNEVYSAKNEDEYFELSAAKLAKGRYVFHVTEVNSNERLVNGAFVVN